MEVLLINLSLRLAILFQSLKREPPFVSLGSRLRGPGNALGRDSPLAACSPAELLESSSLLDYFSFDYFIAVYVLAGFTVNECRLTSVTPWTQSDYS